MRGDKHSNLPAGRQNATTHGGELRDREERGNRRECEETKDLRRNIGLAVSTGSRSRSKNNVMPSPVEDGMQGCEMMYIVVSLCSLESGHLGTPPGLRAP